MFNKQSSFNPRAVAVTTSPFVSRESSDAFAKVTREHVGRQLAVVVDGGGMAASDPDEIQGGNAIISANLDHLSASLAILMECPRRFQPNSWRRNRFD